MKNKNLFILVCLFMLSGCYYPPLLENVELPPDYTYKIGPGDGLEIFVWGNPDISTGVTVRPDGKINTPLIDDLLVIGKTPNELARIVEKELSKFVRDPQVAIMVGGFQGIYSQQVRMIGQISSGGGGGGGGGGGVGGGNRYTAQSVPYVKGMSLLDLIIEIGGIGIYGDGNRSSVVRVIDGEYTQFGVRIDDLIEDADLTANVNIMPGDILLVPEAFF